MSRINVGRLPSALYHARHLFQNVQVKNLLRTPATVDPTGPTPLSSRLKNSPPGERYSLKRKWEVRSSQRSSSGSSSDSYDGPTVRLEPSERRAGFPAPLPQLPLNIKGIFLNDARIPVWQECQSHVRGIFDEAGIDFESIGTYMVKGKNEPQAKPTIIIRVKSNTNKSLWRPTLITVGKMLHSNNALELHATILEPEAEEQDKAFSIPEDHPLIKIWPERLKHAVLEIVDNIDWLQLSVCKWGPTEQAAKPSILIIVKDKTEAPWAKICQTIRETCASRGVAYLEVAVEEGELIGAFGDDSGARQGHQSLQQGIPMGYSIGVELRGGGTMGGYLVLVDPKKPQEKTTIFLTNWHVVRPSNPQLPAEWDNGPRPYGKWPEHTSNIVQCPAQADVNSEIAYIQNLAPFLQGSTKWTNLKARMASGPATEMECDTHQSMADAIQKNQIRLQFLNTHNRPNSLCFGQCMMASGYRKVKIKEGPEGTTGALDWAIGEPIRYRIGGNILPSQEQLDTLAGKGRYDLRGRTHVKYISTLPVFLGQDVFKVGRTTGLTVGKVTQITTWTRIERQPNSAHTRPIRATFEHHTIRAKHTERFNEAGDSGSWIFDEYGNLLGLLWGGCVKSNDCYFTPIQYVIADIEKYTGKKVEMYQA